MKRLRSMITQSSRLKQLLSFSFCFILMSSVRPLHAATPLSDGDNLEGITKEQANLTRTHFDQESAGASYKATKERRCTCCKKKIEGTPHRLACPPRIEFFGYVMPKQVIYFCNEQCEEKFIHLFIYLATEEALVLP